jgi:hypothetical protein
MKPPEQVGALLSPAHLSFLDDPLSHDLTVAGMLFKSSVETTVKFKLK